MIPIKGYATFDPLKSCLIGRNFSGDFFKKNIEKIIKSVKGLNLKK